MTTKPRINTHLTTVSRVICFVVFVYVFISLTIDTRTRVCVCVCNIGGAYVLYYIMHNNNYHCAAHVGWQVVERVFFLFSLSSFLPSSPRCLFFFSQTRPRARPNTRRRHIRADTVDIRLHRVSCTYILH